MTDRLIEDFDKLLEKRGLNTEKFKGKWSNTLTYNHDGIENMFDGYKMGIEATRSTLATESEQLRKERDDLVYALQYARNLIGKDSVIDDVLKKVNENENA